MTAKGTKGTKPGRTYECTRSDLEGATRGDSSKCAVARALARQIPGAREIDVDTQTIRYTDQDGGRWWWATPIVVAQYVSDYDLGLPIGDEAIAGEQLGPFRFTLRHPVKQPRRRLTEEGKAHHAEYNAHVKAIREHHGLSHTAWRSLTTDDRRELIAQARDQGVDIAVVGERSGLSPEPQSHPAPVIGGKPPTSYTEPGRKAPPKVFRSHRRTYGNRVLRWNREPEDRAGGAVV